MNYSGAQIILALSVSTIGLGLSGCVTPSSSPPTKLSPKVTHEDILPSPKRQAFQVALQKQKDNLDPKCVYSNGATVEFQSEPNNRWVVGVGYEASTGAIIAEFPKEQGEQDPYGDLSLSEWKERVRAGDYKLYHATGEGERPKYPSSLDFSIGDGDVVAFYLMPELWQFQEGTGFPIHNIPQIGDRQQSPFKAELDSGTEPRVLFVQYSEPKDAPSETIIHKATNRTIPTCLYKYDLSVITKALDDERRFYQETAIIIDPLMGNDGGPPLDGPDA